MSNGSQPAVSREEALRSAERALSVAAHLLEHRSLRRYDQSIMSLAPTTVGRAVGDQAIGLLIDLALETSPAPIDVLLDRLRCFELSAQSNSRYLGYVEGACVVAFMILHYERAAGALVRDFVDDEDLLQVVARSAAFVMRALRQLFNGDLPSMVGVPTPRVAVMVELERRPSTN